MQPGWLVSEGGRRTDYILHDMCTNNTNIQHSDGLMDGESGLIISSSAEGGDRGGSSSLSLCGVMLTPPLGVMSPCHLL